MYRVLRCMTCFLLICSLLVNFLPTRAEAISTGVAVSAGIVVSAIIYGLGVAIGEYPDDFNSLVSEFITDMETAGVLVTNGLMDVMSLGSGLYGVKSDLVEGLLEWLRADSGILSFGVPMVSSYYFPILGRTISADAPVVVYGYRYDNYGAIRYSYGLCSYNQFQYSGYGSGQALEIGLSDGSTAYYWGMTGIYSATDPKASYIEQLPLVGSGGNYQDMYWLGSFLNENVLSSDHDVTLNFIAEPGISLATGYPAWHANSVTIPNAETGEDETYYPIALGNSMEETQSFTQEQVWAGEGTYVDTETGTGTGSGSVTVPDTVTLKDILTGVISIPQAISIAASNVVAAVQAIPAAIADIFTPKADLGHFSISLSDYFPFCIPFDIYDFLTCLNADPVAPVIEWVIFERDGTGHPITIDLSPFDSVAQILRTLQLLLFCVGLAAKTRDLIKG